MTRFISILCLVLASVMSAASGSAAPDASGSATRARLAGHWRGTTGPHGEFALQVHFFPDSGRLRGTFDLPATGGRGIPLVIRVAGDAVQLAFAEAIAFNGRLAGDSLTGGASFLGRPGLFHLSRTAAPVLPYREEAVRFRNGNVTLAGSLMIPNGAGPHPAVVFFQGSGAAERYADEFVADHLARMGIAALIFDKRGAGQSSGDWTKADFGDLAADALAGVQMLKARRDIVGRRIGLMGASQAGWVIPLAASRSSDVAFMILSVAATTTVARDGLWKVERGLRAAGVPDGDVASAMALLKRNDDVTRTGKGLPELEAAAQAAKDKKWFQMLRFNALPADHPGRLWFRRVLDVDPVPLIRTARIPSLWLYGGNDPTTPTDDCVAMLEGLRKEGHDVTVRVLAGADQALWVTDPQDSTAWPRLAPDYLVTLDGWLGQHGMGRSSTSASPQPRGKSESAEPNRTGEPIRH